MNLGATGGVAKNENKEEGALTGKKMMRRKNKTPKTKNPRCLHIIIYVRILDFCMFATD